MEHTHADLGLKLNDFCGQLEPILRLSGRFGAPVNHERYFWSQKPIDQPAESNWIYLCNKPMWVLLISPGSVIHQRWWRRYHRSKRRQRPAGRLSVRRYNHVNLENPGLEPSRLYYRRWGNFILRWRVPIQRYPRPGPALQLRGRQPLRAEFNVHLRNWGEHLGRAGAEFLEHLRHSPKRPNHWQSDQQLGRHEPGRRHGGHNGR